MKLKELYARLIRLRIVGPFVSGPVRFTKRVLGKPIIHAVDRVEMLAAASSSLRTRADRFEDALAQQQRQIDELTRYCDQLAAVIEAQQARNGAAKPHREAPSASADDAPSPKGRSGQADMTP